LINVKRIIQHKSYKSSTIDFDYSLLELEESVKFDDTKQAIKLASKEPQAGDLLFVSG
jgi:trypsin